MKAVIVLLASIDIAILTACASTGIIPMDNGTYMVAEKGPTLGFSEPIRQTAAVYREANEFCAKQGRKVETVKLDKVDSGLARPASASLQFRCVP